MHILGPSSQARHLLGGLLWCVVRILPLFPPLSDLKHFSAQVVFVLSHSTSLILSWNVAPCACGLRASRSGSTGRGCLHHALGCGVLREHGAGDRGPGGASASPRGGTLVPAESAGMGVPHLPASLHGGLFGEQRGWVTPQVGASSITPALSPLMPGFHPQDRCWRQVEQRERLVFTVRGESAPRPGEATCFRAHWLLVCVGSGCSAGKAGSG